MADLFAYGDKDRHIITYSILILVAILTLLFIKTFDVMELLNSEIVETSSPLIPDILLAIFRTGAAILALYTIFFLMILNKDGGFMHPLFHEERVCKPHNTKGIERMVPFSSWTLILFALYFISSSILGWLDIFNLGSVKIINFWSGIFLPMSLGMAMLTATVVTYVIVPEEVKLKRSFNHLFETHEMVMHNWTAILLALDVFLSRPNLDWELAIFGLSAGIIYSIFAYLYAIYGGGFYVYSFIDPRIKYAPIIMTVLALALSLFYVFNWIITLIIEYNQFLGGLIYVIWIYSIVLFKKPSFDDYSS